VYEDSDVARAFKLFAACEAVVPAGNCAAIACNCLLAG